jgi:hypothetical protein
MPKLIFDEGTKKHTMEKRQPLQQMLLGKAGYLPEEN